MVNFSLEPDVARLVKAGMVSPSWNQNATHGFVTNSVAVLIVRKGNPKHITDWSDLVKPGVEVLTPNPFTSGSARWNIMAAYGAQLKEGKTPAQAQAYLEELFHHVVSQDSSARNALQTFLAGRGDVLIDYEDEAISDQKKGSPIEYVIPSATILIQNPIAVVGSEGSAQAKSFVSYLLSPAGQQIWAEKGYRPVIPGIAQAAQLPDPRGPLHDRIARRLEQGRQAVLRTGNGDRDEDRAVAGGLHCQMRLHVAHRERSAPALGASARARPRCSAAVCWASTCPCWCCCRSRRCWRRPSTGGAGAFWREISTPRGGRGDQAHADRLGDRGGTQRACSGR